MPSQVPILVGSFLLHHQFFQYSKLFKLVLQNCHLSNRSHNIYTFKLFLFSDVICRSSFPRLDFQGFYTVILEKNDVLLCVASIRYPKFFFVNVLSFKIYLSWLVVILSFIQFSSSSRQKYSTDTLDVLHNCQHYLHVKQTIWIIINVWFLRPQKEKKYIDFY